MFLRNFITGMLFLGIFFPAEGFAQNRGRANSFFNKALLSAKQKNWETAIIQIEKSIQLDPTDQGAYSLLGQWLYQKRDYGAAAKVFKTASGLSHKAATAFALPLAKVYLADYNIVDAQILTNNYGQSEAWDPIKKRLTFLRENLNQSAEDTLIKLSERINTP